jgi:hypothetical protein
MQPVWSGPANGLTSSSGGSGGGGNEPDSERLPAHGEMFAASCGVSTSAARGAEGVAINTPEHGGVREPGTWISVRQNGQGPVILSRLTGPLSLMPQIGQKKIIESVSML